MDIECHCQEIFAISIQERTDFEKNSSVEKEILSGQFMNYECPNCKNVLKVEFKMVFDLKPENSMWYFYPEQDRLNALSFSEKNQDPTHRVIIGYKELREKTAIRSENKDDRCIEILKYSFLKVNKEKSLKIYYQGEDKEGLNFFVEGRGDALEKVAVPANSYEKVLGAITSDAEKFEFLKGNYIQANSVTWED